jgi:hypothetical protein
MQLKYKSVRDYENHNHEMYSWLKQPNLVRYKENFNSFLVLKTKYLSSYFFSWFRTEAVILFGVSYEVVILRPLLLSNHNIVWLPVSRMWSFQCVLLPAFTFSYFLTFLLQLLHDYQFVSYAALRDAHLGIPVISCTTILVGTKLSLSS